MREFTDRSGSRWVVYAVNNDDADERSMRYLPEAFRQGWLAFESGDRKLRLTPIPDDWYSAPVDRLQALLQDASPVASTRPQGYRAYGAPATDPPTGRDDSSARS